MKPVIIAIDGYSSCGKSTLAKNIAVRYNFSYVDSGAMYRTVTYFALKNNFIKDKYINFNDLINALDKAKLEFVFDSKTQQNISFLDNKNISDEIRSIKVSDKVSLISQNKKIRLKMVDLQREMSKSKSIVMDGRDIGTVVFPEADIKFFMTADKKVRAKRRFMEIQNSGENVNYDEVYDNIIKRDEMDENREESPLKQAKDAFVIDNTNMSRKEQLEFACKLIDKRLSD